MPTHTLRSAALAALVFATVACKTDSTTPLTSAELLVAADIVADQGAAAATTVQSVLGAETVTGSGAMIGAVGFGSLIGSSASANAAGPHQFGDRMCNGPDANGWYTCSNQRENGFNMVREHRFFGAGGFQTVWGSNTDSAQYRWSLTGVDSVRHGDREHDGDHDDAINHTRWVIEGDTASLVPVRTVGAEARIWNFRGAMDDSSTVVGSRGTRRFHVVASRVGKDITWKLPRMTNPWPVSGTLTINYNTRVIFTDTLGKADTVVKTGATTVTFDGGKPSVPISDHTLRCLLRLDTRRISGCN